MTWLTAPLRGSLAALWLCATAAEASPWSWFSGELRSIEREEAVCREQLRRLPAFPQPQPHECAGFHSGLAPRVDSVRWVQVDLGTERALDAVVIVPAILGSAEAYGFPLRFRVDASNDPLFAEPVTLLDQTARDGRTTVAPWHVTARGVRARHVRFTATRLTAQPRLNGRFVFCLGELMVFSGGRNVALRAGVTAPNAVETLPTWSPRHLVDGWSALGVPVSPEAVPGNGWHSSIETTAELVKWVQVDLGRSHALQEVRFIPAHPADYPDRLGFGFPRRFKVELSDEASFASPRVVFDSTAVDFINPADNAVAFPVAEVPARFVRLTASRLWERSGDFVFALAELQALSGGRDVAVGAQVTASDDTFSQSWSRERLVDGKSSAGALVEEEAWMRQLSERRSVEDALTALRGRGDAAISTAQRTAGWFAAGFAGSVGLVVLAGWRRSRRARHREVEGLRQRISRDLHDEIGSHLGSIRLMSELALKQGDTREALEEIQRLSREAAESMRGIVWLVREGDAPTLERLMDALRQSATELLKGVEWTLVVESSAEPAAASLEFHRHVFLFFREAAHNVARHAKAEKVTMTARWDARQFRLRVEDDGDGFDAAVNAGGSGLANLRHRASLIRGSVEMASTPGQGTRITLEAPLS